MRPTRLGTRTRGMLTAWCGGPESHRAACGQRVVVLTKYPAPGVAKTRLAGALGAEGAARLHRAMTEHLLARLDDGRCEDGTAQRGAGGRRGRRAGVAPVAGTAVRDFAAIEIWYTGAQLDQMRRWLGAERTYRAQSGGDLGARLATAFEVSFSAGVERVVIVGSDCPELSPDDLAQAFAALEHRDVVLGPAVDGGYYLIGARRAQGRGAGAGRLGGLAWGSARMLASTRTRAREAGLSVGLLRTLADVDRPEDLPIWEAARSARCRPHPPRASGAASCENEGAEARWADHPAVAPTISVVVAALDEEQHLGPTLLSAGDGCGVERIVVDGGSRDATAAVARAHGATVLHDAAGRGAQLNTGAAAASGAILLFLHADTLLPVGWGAAVRRALADSNAMLGAFRFQTDSPSLPMAVVERLARFRSSWLGLPYGDQGLFMWAHSFRGLGGFAEQPLLDDLDLVVRARRAGPIVTLPMPAVTSARRWRRHGVLRTTLVNQAVLAGWALGVDPARLASWYRRT